MKVSGRVNNRALSTFTVWLPSKVYEGCMCSKTVCDCFSLLHVYSVVFLDLIRLLGLTPRKETLSVTYKAIVPVLILIIHTEIGTKGERAIFRVASLSSERFLRCSFSVSGRVRCSMTVHTFLLLCWSFFVSSFPPNILTIFSQHLNSAPSPHFFSFFFFCLEAFI